MNWYVWKVKHFSLPLSKKGVLWKNLPFDNVSVSQLLWGDEIRAAVDRRFSVRTGATTGSSATGNNESTILGSSVLGSRKSLISSETP